MNTASCIQLVQCHQAIGRPAEARRLLEELFARKEKNTAAAREKLQAFQEQHKEKKPEELTEQEQDELRGLLSEASWNPYAMEYLMGSLLLAEGDEEGAVAPAKGGSGRRAAARSVSEDRRGLPGDEGMGRRGTLLLTRRSPWTRTTLRRTCCWAQSLLARRRFQEAAEEALAAVGLLYFNPQGHFVLGTALQRLGRTAEAVEALRVAVSQNPNFIAAHRRLAQIYERQLGDETKAAEHRMLAWQAGRRLKAFQEGKKDAGAVGQRAAEEMASLPLKIADQQAESPAPGPHSDDGPVDRGETIAIVSGLPRSGTSLMMQMLQAGGLPAMVDGDRQADADNPRGYFEFAPAKRLRHEASWIPQAKGKAVKIVAQLLPLLTPGFHYRILLMARDLEEVLASQQTMLQRQGQTGAELSAGRLREVFARQLEQTRRVLVARRIPTLTVRYRDCVQRPAEVAAAVNAFLGGALDEPAMVAAVDPSLYRHRGAGTG